MFTLDTAITVSLILTVIGLCGGAARLWLGPSPADRVVSLDLITVLLIAITSLLALLLDNSAYLDLGLVLALIGFLATVAFARYIEQREDKNE